MKPSGSGSVRIIGGRWRGSRLPVAERSGLRPTADRVRETLFNWLQGELHGASCLDLFAGSGALGFEAASRGADRVLLVERDAAQAASLRASAERLQATAVAVRCADAQAVLAELPAAAFDLVFVDPPFASGLAESVLPRLDRVLRPAAWLYLEATIEQQAPQLAADWRLHREGRTREAAYRLFRRDAAVS